MNINERKKTHNMEEERGKEVNAETVRQTDRDTQTERQTNKHFLLSYLEHLVQIFAEILHKVHVRDTGEHQVSGLLGKGHFSLGQPCPVEGV